MRKVHCGVVEPYLSEVFFRPLTTRCRKHHLYYTGCTELSLSYTVTIDKHDQTWPLLWKKYLYGNITTILTKEFSGKSQINKKKTDKHRATENQLKKTQERMIKTGSAPTRKQIKSYSCTTFWALRSRLNSTLVTFGTVFKHLNRKMTQWMRWVNADHQ